MQSFVYLEPSILFFQSYDFLQYYINIPKRNRVISAIFVVHNQSVKKVMFFGENL